MNSSCLRIFQIRFSQIQIIFQVDMHFLYAEKCRTLYEQHNSSKARAHLKRLNFYTNFPLNFCKACLEEKLPYLSAPWQKLKNLVGNFCLQGNQLSVCKISPLSLQNWGKSLRWRTYRRKDNISFPADPLSVNHCYFLNSLCSLLSLVEKISKILAYNYPNLCLNLQS